MKSNRMSPEKALEDSLYLLDTETYDLDVQYSQFINQSAEPTKYQKELKMKILPDTIHFLKEERQLYHLLLQLEDFQKYANQRCMTTLAMNLREEQKFFL